MPRNIILIGILLGAAVACSKPNELPPGQGPSVVPPSPGPPTIDATIAFESTRDGPQAIYVATEDGAQVRRLTFGTRPAWSPDAREIAFTQYDHCVRCGIQVMNADGSGFRFIAEGADPTWSPDGTKIAFRALRHQAQILVMNRDGSNVTLLARDDDPNYYLGDARWLPDGRITYVRSTYGLEAATMSAVRPDGSGPEMIDFDARCNPNDFAWSPDGTSAACGRFYDGLFLASLPGRGFNMLVGGDRSLDAVLFNPAWSPDGREIAFSRYDGTTGCQYPNCQKRLYAAAVSGGAVRRLIPDATSTFSIYHDDHVAWSRRR
jgi:TolB protein